MYGLEDEELKLIIDCIKKYYKVEELYLIGSRASGNYKYNSDIDLVIKGDIEFSTYLMIQSDLEDLNLIYFIDLLNYSLLNDENLIAEINKCNKILYSKNLQNLLSIIH